MEWIVRIPHEIWATMVELSPSLFLGLFLAGLLHVFLPPGLVRRSLSGADASSVLNAVLVGVPMPLCSCGVVPTAIGLRNDGASKGAATGFLISTPQTGVDSILVSASFLGWPFALFKVAAAFVSGMLGGVLVNAAEKGARATDEPVPRPLQPLMALGRAGRVLEVFRYALFDLLALIDVWIVIGVLASAVIAVLLPPGSLVELEWLQGIGGLLAVLVISLPLYVCTTGSVPIAASLIAAGMPLGSALVFLMAGPATNLATMGAVFRTLGGRVLAIYLATVSVASILLGWLFDFVLGSGSAPLVGGHTHGHGWLESFAAGAMSLLLAALLIRRLVLSRRRRAPETPAGERTLTLKVKGMSCQHCVANVKNALESKSGVQLAEPDLGSGLVRIEGDALDPSTLAEAVERAGYKVSILY